MKKLPAPIRENIFLIACVAASLLLHGAALIVGKKAGFVGLPVDVVVVPPGAQVAGAKPAAPGEKVEKLPPGAKLAPPEKQPAQPPAKPVEKKAAPPKPAQKREEKKAPPQPAKPPAKDNLGNADLVPVKVDAPEPMGVDMGQVIRIQVENAGSEVAGVHHDALFYSATGKLDEKAASLGMVEVPGGLAPGAKMWERAQVLLPEKTPSGRAYLIVVLNADGFMPETNHANNQMVVPIMVDADSVPLGDPNERPRSTVAWIASKDFRELRARQSTTLQPAVQNDATTTATAKPDVLAGAKEAVPAPKGVTAVKPQDKKEQKETPPVAKGTEKKPEAQVNPPKVATQSKPEVKEKPETKPEVKPEVVVTKTEPKPAVKPEEKSKPEVKKAPEVVKVAPPKPDKFRPREGQAADPKAPVLALAQPDKKATPATAKAAESATGKAPEKPPVKVPDKVASAAEKPEAKPETKPEAGVPQQGEGPTSAVADNSSAVPTQLDENNLEPQPGRVLVGKGVRINTARMRRPGTAALIAGAAANPRAAVTFNAAGEAVKVELTRPSGNADWDAVVTESLYRWTAEGEEVKKGNLVVRWTILIGAND